MYLVFLVNKHDPLIQTVIFVHIVEPFQEGVTVSVSLFMKLGNMSVRKKTPNFLSHYILVAFDLHLSETFIFSGTHKKSGTSLAFLWNQ